MTEYTPTVWQDGDAITAEKLNKIENRIEEISSIKRVHKNNNIMKYNEVKSALDQGIFPCFIENEDNVFTFFYNNSYYEENGNYSCTAINFSNGSSINFVAQNENSTLFIN